MTVRRFEIPLGSWTSTLFAASALALGAACATPQTRDADANVDGATVDAQSEAGAPCVPDEAQWSTTVRPLVERYCGQCHGAVPNFGAPSSLRELASIAERRADGLSGFEHIAERVARRSMPPASLPRLPDDDARAIAAWASCGRREVQPSNGLVASAPPLLAPERAPAGLTPIEIRADRFPVEPTVRDAYRCFVIEPSLAEPRFVRRFEAIIDESRVLHHIVLSKDVMRTTALGNFDCNGGGGMPNGAQYLFVWAPGQTALEFPSGGLRVAPGDRFILQIHYNNGAGVPDVRDSSGVRLFTGPAVGTEYGMFSVGSMTFSLPPRQRSTVEGRCTIRRATTLYAGMPHMHLLGAEFETSLLRQGSPAQNILSLRGWSFESQLFYSLPIELRPGDVLRTRCTFDNPNAEPVRVGERTVDEMCNNFIFATPPPESPLCDEGSPDRPTDVAYQPGVCLPASAPRDTALVRGSWTQAMSVVPLRAGPIADGRWVIDAADVTATGGATPIGDIDFSRSYTLARGQVITNARTLTFDVTTDTVLLFASGTRFGMPQHQSFTVPLDDTVATVDATATCPSSAGRTRFEWGIEGDALTVRFTRSEIPGQTLWARYRFRRVP